MGTPGGASMGWLGTNRVGLRLPDLDERIGFWHRARTLHDRNWALAHEPVVKGQAKSLQPLRFCNHYINYRGGEKKANRFGLAFSSSVLHKFGAEEGT
jgi:hypothetical protein